VPADRRELARLAAPVAFLIGITILIVLVHSALSSGGGTTTAAATTTAEHTTTKAKPKPTTTKAATTTATTGTTSTSTGPAQYYTIQSGDTFGAIASREGTTVQELVALNPGVNPNALTVGQQIRIK
jgi:LysM repeat protein